MPVLNHSCHFFHLSIWNSFAATCDCCLFSFCCTSQGKVWLHLLSIPSVSSERLHSHPLLLSLFFCKLSKLSSLSLAWCSMFQSSNHIGDPPLPSPQLVHETFLLRDPKLDTVLQMLPHNRLTAGTLFQDFKQDPWCSLIHRTQAELLCLLWQSFCTGWYIEICAISSGLFVLFGKQQLSVFWHTISYILFVGWRILFLSLFVPNLAVLEIILSLVYNFSHLWKGYCTSVNRLLQSFSQTFKTFNLTFASISKLHLFTCICKSEKKKNPTNVFPNMLIHKLFALLAVMDRPTSNLFGSFCSDTLRSSISLFPHVAASIFLSLPLIHFGCVTSHAVNLQFILSSLLAPSLLNWFTTLPLCLP